MKNIMHDYSSQNYLKTMVRECYSNNNKENKNDELRMRHLNHSYKGRQFSIYKAMIKSLPGDNLNVKDFKKDFTYSVAEFFHQLIQLCLLTEIENISPLD